MSSGPRQLVTTSPKRNVRQCLSAFPLTPWKSPKNVDCSNASPMTVSLVVRLGGVLAVFIFGGCVLGGGCGTAGGSGPCLNLRSLCWLICVGGVLRLCPFLLGLIFFVLLSCLLA